MFSCGGSGSGSIIIVVVGVGSGGIGGIVVVGRSVGVVVVVDDIGVGVGVDNIGIFGDRVVIFNVGDEESGVRGEVNRSMFLDGSLFDFGSFNFMFGGVFVDGDGGVVYVEFVVVDVVVLGLGLDGFIFGGIVGDGEGVVGGEWVVIDDGLDYGEGGIFVVV